MTEAENKLVFDKNGCIYSKDDKQIIHVKTTDGIYKICVNDTKCLLTTTNSDNAMTAATHGSYQLR